MTSLLKYRVWLQGKEKRSPIVLKDFPKINDWLTEPESEM